jgi:hypothetical protein
VKKVKGNAEAKLWRVVQVGEVTADKDIDSEMAMEAKVSPISAVQASTSS